MTAARGQLNRLARVIWELPPTAAAVRRARVLAARAAWRTWWDALTTEDLQRLEVLLSRPQGCEPAETFRGVTVGAVKVALAECGQAECRQFLARCAARGGGPPDVCAEASDPAAECMDRLMLLLDGRYPGAWEEIVEDLRGSGMDREAALAFLDEVERAAPFEDD